jgi:predicted metalloendopeptidase
VTADRKKKSNLRAYSYDADTEPCDNFYDYACGTFLQKSIPDELVTVGSLSEMKEYVDQLVVSMIEVRPGDSHLDKLVGQLHSACAMRNSEF